jgi:hypothetical protein
MLAQSMESVLFQQADTLHKYMDATTLMRGSGAEIIMLSSFINL